VRARVAGSEYMSTVGSRNLKKVAAGLPEVNLFARKNQELYGDQKEKRNPSAASDALGIFPHIR